MVLSLLHGTQSIERMRVLAAATCIGLLAGCSSSGNESSPDPLPSGSSSGSSSSSSSSSGNSENLSNWGNVRVPMGSVQAPPVAIRRLNRAEYNNTVRDLFVTQLRPADRFPEDDFGYGFNNIARVLSVSLAHIEQYRQAAESLAEEAVNRSAPKTKQTFEAEALSGESITVLESTVFMGVGGATLNLVTSVEHAGTYTLDVLGGQEAAGGEDARLGLALNGLTLNQSLDISAPVEAMDTHSVTLELSKGTHQISLTFENDYWVQDVADRNLVLDSVALDGPTVSGEKIIQCDLDTGVACARATAQNFGARAWRRPLENAEVDKLLATYKAGFSIADRVSDGMSAMLQTLILSPNFIFRSEVDVDLSAREAYPLNAYTLASRLSYFVWGSMPDTALFDAAANGTLLNEATLRAQVKRMLQDTKAVNFIEQFAVQWLKFDTVEDSTPDPQSYPGFTPALMESMRQETRLFLTDWFENNGRLADLLESNYSFLNGALAAHYGVGTIDGEDFVRHEWGDDRRAGLLGHASILTATSHPVSTSPVLRGKWVLDTLACKSPPPPPPGVENLSEGAGFEELTTRERFEQHRDASSVCFGCHVLMDPIGFGMENFDAIGRWREYDGNEEVDSAGSLPGGYQFAGSVELASVLATSAELPLCATKHLLTYALGRGIDALDPYKKEDGLDDPLVYQIYLGTLEGGHRIHDLIEEVILSSAFRNRFGMEASGEISL